MSSNDCQNCDQMNEIINEQKNKLLLIESRMKDLIKAYKSVVKEKDNLLAINCSAVLPLNDSHEQQKRLSILESSVAEMSVICGKYESERNKDKELIEELTQKCEQLVIDLEMSQSFNINNMSSSEESKEIEQKVRHRGIQTEESFETFETQNELLSDQNIESDQSLINNGIDVETQTDFDNSMSRKKSELAIVVPTQRQLDSDQLSNTSSHYSSSPTNSNDNNYPVFTSNAREIHSNKETLFANTSSHGVSLFYANELARKEIDLAESRLQAREYECALRELQWKYNTDKYRLQSRINDLERHYSQMSSNQPMTHLNITYIRNVLIKLLNTKDKQQKQFMINAILTALESKDRKPK